MPTRPELEAFITELESLLTTLEAERDIQKERSDEWQTLAEYRESSVTDFPCELQEALKKARKSYDGKKLTSRQITKQIFPWYKEHRKLGYNQEESLYFTAAIALHMGIKKAARNKNAANKQNRPLSAKQVKKIFRKHISKDFDSLVNEE